MATIVIEKWSDIGLNVNLNAVNVKTTCPECSESRKNKRDKCLSISPGKGVGTCHNCQTSYVIKSDSYQAVEKVYTKPEVKQIDASIKTIKFFESRGIEARTLEYFKIKDSTEWMYGKSADPDKKTPEVKEGPAECINFPYYENSELINVKFRASLKRFRMVQGAKLIFFNLDAIKDSDWCAIQEGEIDTMTAYQCGVYKSISVPNGASRGSQKLEYLDNCIEYFANKTKIIIATDGDAAGTELGEELIRRLGRERCYTIQFPEGCKDTNEVLLKYQKEGPSMVKSMYDNAKPLPVEGIVTGESIKQKLIEIWENGYPKGARIGFDDLDKLITWREGEVTLWTGMPGSGKSELIDQVLVRLSARHGWRHAIFSPENEPEYQASALISKFVGGEMNGSGKISEMKRDKGIEFINDHFFFMQVEEIDVTIDGILQIAKELVLKKGIKLLLIDPYNYIEHKIPLGYTETMYVSELMTKIVTFAKKNKIHIFLVAHPTKIQKDAKTGKYKPTTLYDISGSANFFNKTFNGVSVYRDYEEKSVKALVQKVKFKWIGHVGEAYFTYEYATGRYAHPGQPYESELERYFHKESQPTIPFEEPALPPIREPGQLSDFNSMKLETNFDYKPSTDPAPF